MAGRARCFACNGMPSTVRTPWGATVPVNGPARGAYDSAAGSERVVVVHAGGISRMVVPGPGWSGVVVEGFELHHCGGSS